MRLSFASPARWDGAAPRRSGACLVEFGTGKVVETTKSIVVAPT